MVIKNIKKLKKQVKDLKRGSPPALQAHRAAPLRSHGPTSRRTNVVVRRDPYGSFRKRGVPHFGVLIIGLLLFWGTLLGSPIFGQRPNMEPKKDEAAPRWERRPGQQGVGSGSSIVLGKMAQTSSQNQGGGLRV